MEDDKKADIYGRLDVSIKESSYEAGKISTVAILLRNPFDKPVEILEIQGPRSSHLQEIQSIKSEKGVPKDLSITKGTSEKKKSWISSWFDFLIRDIAFTEIKFGGVTAVFPKSEKSIRILAQPKSEIEIDYDLSNYDYIKIQAEESAKIKILPKDKSNTPIEKKSIIIQPHCESVAYFQISTSGWLFFTPSRQTLNTQLRYRIDDKERTQVVSSEFEIKPPLFSMVIGSIFGAILGTLAKVLNSAEVLNWQALSVSMGSSVVMALIATIALSRKTGSQGFITVEDFFGGFIVGVLIGYGGSEYFEKAIKPDKT